MRLQRHCEPRTFQVISDHPDNLVLEGTGCQAVLSALGNTALVLICHVSDDRVYWVTQVLDVPIHIGKQRVVLVRADGLDDGECSRLDEHVANFIERHDFSLTNFKVLQVGKEGYIERHRVCVVHFTCISSYFTVYITYS